PAARGTAGRKAKGRVVTRPSGLLQSLLTQRRWSTRRRSGTPATRRPRAAAPPITVAPAMVLASFAGRTAELATLAGSAFGSRCRLHRRLAFSRRLAFGGKARLLTELRLWLLEPLHRFRRSEAVVDRREIVVFIDLQHLAGLVWSE